MAHNCPDCGRVCYCGGDIADCVDNHPDDVDNCECECWMDDEYDDWTDDELAM